MKEKVNIGTRMKIFHFYQTLRSFSSEQSLRDCGSFHEFFVLFLLPSLEFYDLIVCSKIPYLFSALLIAFLISQVLSQICPKSTSSLAAKRRRFYFWFILKDVGEARYGMLGDMEWDWVVVLFSWLHRYGDAQKLLFYGFLVYFHHFVCGTAIMISIHSLPVSRFLVYLMVQFRTSNFEHYNTSFSSESNMKMLDTSKWLQF